MMGMLEKPVEKIDAEEKAQTIGVVVALGPLCWKDPHENGVARCEAGDEVMISAYTGAHFTGTDGEKYRVITDKDVLCVMEKP